MHGDNPIICFARILRATLSNGCLSYSIDNDDGHKRLTKGDNFILVGGSEETHETMKETAIKFNEQLSRRGKHLEELSKDEFIDMMRNASEK